MTVFFATLNQTAFLFCFIVLGFVLMRWKFIPDNSHTVLSKLENYVFVPALVLGTFLNNFTRDQISTAWQLLCGSLILALIAIVLSLLCVRFCSRDPYIRKIFTYGLCFSNFGFMGNAVVSALFPEIFLEYLIFTLPLWSLIYLWGVPTLLMADSSAKQTLSQRMKNFVNPMFICTLLGMALGLAQLPIPQFFRSAVTTAGSCMSPVAMLLTGMTVARFRLDEVLRIRQVYVVTILRLLVYPLVFLGAMLLIPFEDTFAVCAVCSLAMPLGLNTIIIPSSLGRDTKVASGMAIVSHVLSCVTIPLIFMLFEFIR